MRVYFGVTFLLQPSLEVMKRNIKIFKSELRSTWIFLPSYQGHKDLMNVSSITWDESSPFNLVANVALYMCPLLASAVNTTSEMAHMAVMALRPGTDTAVQRRGGQRTTAGPTTGAFCSRLQPSLPGQSRAESEWWIPNSGFSTELRSRFVSGDASR